MELSSNSAFCIQHSVFSPFRSSPSSESLQLQSEGAASSQSVLVLDFGSQYTQLIARRIREQNVYSVVHPFDFSPDQIRKLAPRAIILSGGPQSVYAETAPICSREVFDLGVPILGICYGMQLTAYLLDGKVEAATEREYGRAEIEVTASDSPLFAGTPKRQQVWESHGDRIIAPPPGFVVTATSANAPISAFESRERRCFGIEFHPEVTHSEAGTQILRNFLFDIAGCKPNWDLGDFRRRKVEEIREQVGDRHVIAAVSGGVDSSVAALLVAEAIGDQLTAIFVDNGVLRKNEAMQVVSRLSEGLGMHIVAVDAAAFLRQARRHRRPRGEAQADRERVHRGVRRGSASHSECRVPRARERSIPTSSSRCRSKDRRRSSRRITTSAACRRRWA